MANLLAPIHFELYGGLQYYLNPLFLSNFPKATQRNRIRRQIREAYRLNKHTLYQKIATLESERGALKARQYAIMVIYIAKESLPFQSIEQATQKWIDILVKKISKDR